MWWVDLENWDFHDYLIQVANTVVLIPGKTHCMIAIHTHQEVWFTMTYADISILIKNKINNKLVYWSFFCKKSYHHIFDLKLYSGVWQPAKKAWLLGEFVVIKRCMKRCNVDGNNL